MSISSDRWGQEGNTGLPRREAAARPPQKGPQLGGLDQLRVQAVVRYGL